MFVYKQSIIVTQKHALQQAKYGTAKYTQLLSPMYTLYSTYLVFVVFFALVCQ